MEAEVSTTKKCPFCAEQIQAEAVKCRYCGSDLSTAGNATPATKPTAPAPTRSPLQITGGVFMVLVATWGLTQTVLTWIAHVEGLIGPLVPVWNCVFVLALIGITIGVFMRREWARQWALGICVLNGASNAWAAISSNAALFWVGVVVQAATAALMIAAKKDFALVDQTRTGLGLAGQLLSAVALLGSLAVGFIGGTQHGTVEGREAFVAEVRTQFPPTVAVKMDGLDLRLESPTDPDEQVKTGADLLRAQLRQNGANAKAWAVGFQRIIVTNGAHTETITPGQ